MDRNTYKFGATVPHYKKMSTLRDKVQLSGKEAALFKTILRFYEHKQYKKGLKATETILKKYPNHGETTAMKGLFLSHLNRSAEAHAFVKMGLRLDLTSHICWHVYGLLHRSEKNFEEAIKCYHHALKYDKENINIIRDYSLLLVQMRNYDQYVTIRHQLLTIKPNNKMYWIGVVVAHHLNKQYSMAIKILDAFQTSQEQIEDRYEYSELMLYRNMIIEENGEYKEALEHLRTIEQGVKDRVTFQECKARILIALNKMEAASGVYHSLLEQNSDSEEYLSQLEMCSVSVDDEFYSELRARFPKSKVIQKAQLNHASEDKFKDFLDDYLKTDFLKGVPSLFVSVKSLYIQQWRIEIVEQLVHGYHSSLLESKCFPGEDSEAPPTAYLWIAYFLAQHYDYLGLTDLAFEWVGLAEKHTPTLPEIHMVKAKIYKHAGSTKLAMESMNDARELDLQDRFINTKCTKYMLRNDDDRKARDTISLFTKTDVDPLDDLNSMQCIWFAVESAESFLRLKKYGPAMKRFAQIENHFVEFYDDQFDFHNYCLRKSTLRNYIKLLRNEDTIREHKFWSRASIGAIQTYIAVMDKEVNPLEQVGELSAAEKKKLARKAKKAEQQQQAVQAAAVVKNSSLAKKEDDDPEGLKLVDIPVDKLLTDAIKFLIPLQELSPKILEGWIYGVELYSRQEKFLLAWRSLKKASELAPSDPQVFEQCIKFYRKLEPTMDSLSPTIQSVLKREFEISSVNIVPPSGQNQGRTILDTLISEHSSSASHMLIAISLLFGLFNEPERAQELLLLTIKEASTSLDLKSAIGLWRYSVLVGGDVERDVGEMCRNRFKYATGVFGE